MQNRAWKGWNYRGLRRFIF